MWILMCTRYSSSVFFLPGKPVELVEDGAGDGNRTRVASLEGRRHPPPEPLPGTTATVLASRVAGHHRRRLRFVSQVVSRARSERGQVGHTGAVRPDSGDTRSIIERGHAGAC